MSAVLDTVRSFSDVLSGELVQAVKQQDEYTVSAFNSIAESLEDARAEFLSGLKSIEKKFLEDFTKLADERASAMKDLGAALDAKIDKIEQTVNEVKARYADKKAE